VVALPESTVAVDRKAQAGVAALPPSMRALGADELLIAARVSRRANAMFEQPFGEAGHVSSSRHEARRLGIVKLCPALLIQPGDRLRDEPPLGAVLLNVAPVIMAAGSTSRFTASNFSRAGFFGSGKLPR